MTERAFTLDELRRAEQWLIAVVREPWGEPYAPALMVVAEMRAKAEALAAVIAEARRGAA